ncbi:MAG: type II secretion system F family protein [Candidatus Brocadiae bacterium]|nr:type II secretion system F family protein [Candidatus Brocadiia bacterium]
MARFEYTAVDSTGRQVAGSVVADTRAAAMQRVVESALQPVSVNEATAEPGGLSFGGRRVPQASVDAFTRELANLLGAGVSMSRALHILSEEAAKPAARRQWSAIREDVVGGMSLADALALRPDSFPAVYVAMVRAGEAGGFLDAVLGQIADFRERERDLKGKAKSALVYPAVLAVLAMMVMIFLLTYFIPRFAAIFEEFGGALPWLTRAIVRTSDLLVDHGFAVGLAAILAVVAFRRTSASESGRRWMDRTVLRVPALGHVAARFALVRFCRMLGTLLGAGVPLVAALNAAKEAIGNQTLADTVTSAVEGVQQGAPLARSLAASPKLFPASVVEMVSVGEETGSVHEELVRLANTYERDLDRELRMLVALAEPALLFAMAALIGTVVIGMLLPVFTLQELIR